MSLRRKIFLAFVGIIIFSGICISYWAQKEARNSYAYVIEELLIDVSNLISADIENDLNADLSFTKSTNYIKEYYDNFKKKNYSIKILSITKKDPSIDIYVTNDKGIVVYSSRNSSEIGLDYSGWRDVSLTLQGKYGSRATRVNKLDQNTSEYYIAAPIYYKNKIVGVVSVIKARTSITAVLDLFFNKIFMGVLFAIIIILIFGSLLFAWITNPIESLKKYALSIATGEKTNLPQFPHREIQQLAEAFEQMRISLEGHKKVEQFIQSLIHELKSPLSAIKGSSELMLEPMTEEQRQRFLSNIVSETNRSEQVLDTILSIAKLESQKNLSKTERVNLVNIILENQESLMSLAEKQNIAFSNHFKSDPMYINGDQFLLTQSVRNIFQNAIDFSNTNGTIETSIEISNNQVQIKIQDSGVGIPEFAKDKIFDKFFSLERPKSGKKSTGLGLSFVKEVIQLHQGAITVSNENNKTTFKINLPLDNFKS